LNFDGEYSTDDGTSILFALSDSTSIGIHLQINVYNMMMMMSMIVMMVMMSMIVMMMMMSMIAMVLLMILMAMMMYDDNDDDIIEINSHSTSTSCNQ